MISDVKLSVDLSSIIENHTLLRERFTGETCAATVKANAYGLGAVPVVDALYQSGCMHYYVASMQEAIQLRISFPDIWIGVFRGISEDNLADCLSHRITPALSSVEQCHLWQQAVDGLDNKPEAMLMFNTGMNRLGIDIHEIDQVKDVTFPLHSIMSHLACADTPEHFQNVRQLTAMYMLKSAFKGTPISLCNSSGMFMTDEYHFDIARPGCALYGINPTPYAENPMHTAATVEARILQVRTLQEDSYISYSATHKATKGTRIAAVAMGYADGLPWNASGSGLHGYIEGHYVPVIGRISMDMTVLDISSLPENLCHTQAYVEMLGKHCKVDDNAAYAHTIGYEILTSLGARCERNYTGTHA